MCYNFTGSKNQQPAKHTHMHAYTLPPPPKTTTTYTTSYEYYTVFEAEDDQYSDEYWVEKASLSNVWYFFTHSWIVFSKSKMNNMRCFLCQCTYIMYIPFTLSKSKTIKTNMKHASKHSLFLLILFELLNISTSDTNRLQYI